MRRGTLRHLARSCTISHGFVSILAESEMKMDVAIGVIEAKEAIKCESGLECFLTEECHPIETIN